MNKPQLSAKMEKRLLDLLPLGLDDWIVEDIKHFLATALEEQRQEFINQKANQHDAMVRVDERAKVLSEVDGWLDEMKKYDWGDLTDYETHEVGIPKGYKRAVNELVAKLNQLKEEG